MKFQIQDSKKKPIADGLVLAYFSKEKPSDHTWFKILLKSDQKQVAKLFSAKEFSGQEKQQAVVHSLRSGKIILIGLGDKSKWQERRLVLVARQIIQVAKQAKVKSLALNIDNLSASLISSEKLSQLVVENMIMADYTFNVYKEKKDNIFSIQKVLLGINKLALQPSVQGVKTGEVVGSFVNYARDLGNTPGGDMTPELLAQKAKAVGKENKVKVTVLNKQQIKANKMGAILGVAKGSSEDPRFIIMEYWGAGKKDQPYVFVGKGVTFDSGGLNLKPTSGMDDMWMDMLGGAAVISAIGAIAKLKLPVNVVGLIPSVENMLSSSSYRPGDLLRGMSGKSIEILNTDAEGRVILSDALTYAEKFNPKLVVDVATLTGSCVVALGLRMSGLFTVDEKIQSDLYNVGLTSGDYVWPMPMWEEYEDDIKGTFGDVQNAGKQRYGDAISGAMFLYQFAKKYPWAHLDIAGPMKAVDGQFLAKGASGVGVRFLIELIKSKIK